MCNLDGCGSENQGPLPIVSETERRDFLKGLAVLPLASVLAYPELSKAQAATGTSVTFPGNTRGVPDGALFMPKGSGKFSTILVIHEWWGLNDQTKSVAAELAAMGYIALAVDMFGKPPTTVAAEAQAMMNGVDPVAGTKQLVTAVNFLKNHPQSNGKVATIGWCFGGGWSLKASIAAPVDATIIYYGLVTDPAAELAKVKGPILGHFATLDEWINKPMVDGFESELKKAGKKNYALHWYKADHAFANPSNARYDKGEAKASWDRTTAFLKANI